MFNIPIILNSNDGVCDLVVGLHWNPSQATYIGIQKGSGAALAEFSVDSRQSGYANIVVDNALNPMAGQIAILQFDGDPNTVFTSSGITASDNLGRLMSVSSSGANITTNGVRADYVGYDPRCWNPGGSQYCSPAYLAQFNQGNNNMMIPTGGPGPTTEQAPPINPSSLPRTVAYLGPPTQDQVVSNPPGITLDSSAVSNVSSGLSGIFSSLTSSPNFVTYLVIGVGAYLLLGTKKR